MLVANAVCLSYRQIWLEVGPWTALSSWRSKRASRKHSWEAKGAYDSAKDEYLQALNRREDLGLSHPDGALTYRLAMKNRALALQTYNLALIRFNRFILDGKLPEEPT